MKKRKPFFDLNRNKISSIDRIVRKFQLSNLREKQIFLILHCREGEQLVFFLSKVILQREVYV